jgi:D-lyxose ketol-isomerase
MKRSEINMAIDKALAFFRENNFPLPPFAYWTLRQRKQKIGLDEEIIKARLGWDVTDFGLGNFKHYGRTIFTLRNGFRSKKGWSKPYAQKVMYLEENQKSPVHYHEQKTEDIINQGGGLIVVRLEERKIILNPGESVCIKPGTYHQFYARKGFGPVISMEISSVNDDVNDNFWLAKVSRYPEIVEDEKPTHIMCWEYQKFFPRSDK